MTHLDFLYREWNDFIQHRNESLPNILECWYMEPEIPWAEDIKDQGKTDYWFNQFLSTLDLEDYIKLIKEDESTKDESTR